MESRPLYIVTGASGGMGQVLTTELLRRGYRTVMACRDLKKSEPIRQRILQRCSVSELELLPLDLASLDSIRQFAERLKQRNETIGVLINNAGSMNGSFRLSQDGYEMTTAVNYIGTAALTLSLLPYLWGQVLEVENVKMLVNYGIEKLRFNQAVTVGSEVRLRATLVSIANLRGIAKAEIKVSLEIRDCPKTAMDATVIFLYHFK